jgi:hypothetical protein
LCRHGLWPLMGYRRAAFLRCFRLTLGASRCAMQSGPGPRYPRRALQLLADVGQSGATEAIMLAHGFPAATLAGMMKDGFITEAIDTVRAGARMIDVRRLHITQAGRRALADTLRRS